MQMGIAIVAVILTSLMTENMAYTNILMLGIKSFLFVLIYIMINHVLKTKSYLFVLSEIKPIIENKFKGKI